jgi:hypothetical protein
MLLVNAILPFISLDVDVVLTGVCPTSTAVLTVGHF